MYSIEKINLLSPTRTPVHTIIRESILRAEFLKIIQFYNLTFHVITVSDITWGEFGWSKEYVCSTKKKPTLNKETSAAEFCSKYMGSYS